MNGELHAVLNIAAGALGGAAVGVERQWSGHASGPAARFAGVRTFTLLGGFSAIAGWLWASQYQLLAAVLLAGAVGLVVAAYVAASRHSVEGTTEVAALVVVAAGIIAGTGHLALASGIIAVTDLVLVEKSRLHALVSRLDDAEMRAGARFAVMAVVILPLLPSGPYGPLGGVRPRLLWALVLLFSGLSFAAYIARRAVGTRYGYPVTGLLGGLISSTSVTLAFARTSQTHPQLAQALAFGAIAASVVLPVRLLVATAIIHLPLARTLAAYLGASLLAGAVMVAVGIRRLSGPGTRVETPANPLGIWAAMQLAVLFQVVLFGVYGIRNLFGEIGLLASGAVLGLTDTDALTISMAQSAAAGVPVRIAAQAITIGVLANTLLKLAIALAIGPATFRRPGGLGLALLALAAAAPLVAL